MFLKNKKSTEMKFITEVEDHSETDWLVDRLSAFKNIQKICKLNNIEIIFVFSPNFRTFNDSFKNRFEKLVFPENKIMVYDTLNPIFKNEKYYYDVSHLNGNGADIFTSELISFIEENNI